MSGGRFTAARVTVIVLTALTLGTPAASLLGLNAGTAFAQRKHDTCDYCHNLHGAAEAQLTDYVRAEDLCMSCHADGAPATYNGETVPKGVAVHAGGKHTSPDTTSCRDCHDHEGETGSNLALIPVTLDNRYTSGASAVVFLDTTDFADGDATYDGICEVCHTATDYHRQAGGMPAHNNQKDCPACHTHASGFAPAGGACTDCHASGQGSRRAIVAEFDRVSHHAATPADTLDCVVCHDQSEHQQGNVRLWNVDDPGNTAAAIVLTGDPNASAAEAVSLNSFCLTCHDADGANGDTTPFTDGTTVPAVDAAAWALASHNSSSPPVSCYGDGDFGCHASGHGSEKLKLLAPAGVPATAPANAEQEEGFCLNCHDSSGPSSIDLNSAFSRAINWVQQATGLNSNPNLNDRHDVQQAAQVRSGAKIECVDCHDPHRATSAMPFILDPDPTVADGHVVGTDSYYYAYTSYADTLSEFCLDCHDGTFTPGVQDHASPTIVNIQSTWANDGMGGRSQAANGLDLEGDDGWGPGSILTCSACHVAHPNVDASLDTTSHFMLVDTVKSRTGVALDGYYAKQGNNWLQTFDYGVVTNASSADPVSDAGTWCNTCHNRTAMVTKDDCYACHRHGDGGRF
jgi:predicted CXXCH cytochrome family protein